MQLPIQKLVKMLISFFQETHTLKKEIDCFADICQMWLEGCSFVEMHERTSLPIADLEDICSKSISYELSFFVGNVMDIIEINDEDLVNPLPNLLLLQRRFFFLRYFLMPSRFRNGSWVKQVF